MSIANYSDLQAAVSNWLNRSDLTSFVPDFITLGESRLYRELRLRTMETALSDTIASGSISVPSDYIELKFAYLNTSPVTKLQRRSPDFIYEKYPTRSSDGVPAFIAREGSNFIFGPYPDSAYTVKGLYYARLTALSSSSTNWFTTNAPDILLYASLLGAEAFIKNDPRLQLWESLYQQAKLNIEMEDKKERYSGSPATSVVSFK